MFTSAHTSRSSVNVNLVGLVYNIMVDIMVFGAVGKFSTTALQ